MSTTLDIMSVGLELLTILGIFASAGTIWLTNPQLMTTPVLVHISPGTAGLFLLGGGLLGYLLHGLFRRRYAKSFNGLLQIQYHDMNELKNVDIRIECHLDTAIEFPRFVQDSADILLRRLEQENKVSKKTYRLLKATFIYKWQMNM